MSERASEHACRHECPVGLHRASFCALLFFVFLFLSTCMRRRFKTPGLDMEKA